MNLYYIIRRVKTVDETCRSFLCPALNKKARNPENIKWSY